ncbi:ferritin-like domain-containing protein [Ferruginivarius sediminum]|uniref:Iminophenyl-pyruvate dimer synthase domain-containing protein n=1 Tax=Ferruginivarius sediminum TaxID=2661937 RepID=A0A369T9B8_9PROT|nr:ferritin-like domain-containing protein [Ferruginivarius sediminum]RDD60767.1 hypothetical protein DRB17_16345 [Ferruginivarius sediminum]
MSDQSQDNPYRIFPRNLTAHAAEIVRGNPVNTRPESGVDNSHPGLEFDQRMMSRAFFPGLVFDFQYGIGAKLVEIRPEVFTHPYDLEAKDVPADSEDAKKALWLWYIGGRFGGNPDKHVLKDLYGRDGYNVVRAVTDLEDDTIVVVFGKQPDELDMPSAKVWLRRFLDPKRLIDGFKDSLFGADDGLELGGILRDDDGEVQIGVLVGPRAKYLNEEGVIDPDLVAAGELTQSLCSPWQWDFADCGCYYWAGSKPDIVKPPQEESGPDIPETLCPSDDQMNQQSLNFQRDRSKPVPDKPATTPEAWHENEMSQPDMVQHWETLPFVLDERETSVYRPTVLPDIDDAWDREKVREELAVVATAEHALCVEYLYAMYSLKAPPIPAQRRYGQSPLELPRDLAEADEESRIFAASHEIFMIAVEEMRHLRWANEALMLLGGEPTMDRAEVIGRQPTQQQLPFKLAPLTRKQLDDFISVEKSSPFFAEPEPTSLDGIYTHMQVSIQKRPQDYPEPGLQEKLLQLIKLIIDEGVSHYERFCRVRRALDDIDEADYLAVTTEPRRATEEHYAVLQDLADAYYDTLLRGVGLTLLQGNASRGVLLEQARRSMYNLHDTAYRLARGGYGVLFTLPQWLIVGRTPDGAPLPFDPEGTKDALRQTEALAKPAEAPLAKLEQSTDPETRKAMEQHRSTLDEMVAGIRRILS